MEGSARCDTATKKKAIMEILFIFYLQLIACGTFRISILFRRHSYGIANFLLFLFSESNSNALHLLWIVFFFMGD
jgi:hypothetical protein